MTVVPPNQKLNKECLLTADEYPKRVVNDETSETVMKSNVGLAPSRGP